MVDLSTNYLFISQFTKTDIASTCSQYALSIIQTNIPITRGQVDLLCKQLLRSYDGKGKINVGTCKADLGDWLKTLGLVLPASVLKHLGTVCDMVQNFLDQSTKLFQWNYLAWANPGIGRYCIFLFIEGILFFAVVLLLEYHVVQRLFSWMCACASAVIKPVDGGRKTQLDYDVVAEQKRVLEDPTAKDVLTMKEITKVFAVQGMFH